MGALSSLDQDRQEAFKASVFVAPAKLEDGEFFVQEREKALLVSYKIGDSYGICGIEQAYNLSREELEKAEVCKRSGYQLIGAKTVDGKNSPHVDFILRSLPLFAQENLYVIKRNPELLAHTVWSELVFAKCWDTTHEPHINPIGEVARRFAATARELLGIV